MFPIPVLPTRFPQKKKPRCGHPCGSRVGHEDCADVREKASASRTCSFTSPNTGHDGSSWISTIYLWASSLIRQMLRTLGNIFLISPLHCTAFPSALKHPQMSFQYAYENCSHWDPLWGHFKRSQFAFMVSEVFVLLASPRVLWLLRRTAHFSEVLSPLTLFPRRWQKSFFAFALQHNGLRDLECCTWPSHCSAKWEQACSVCLSQGLQRHHVSSPFPHYLSLHSSLVKKYITTSSLKNVIALLSTSVSLSLGITQLNPFGVLSVYSSWILNYFFPLNR